MNNSGITMDTTELITCTACKGSLKINVEVREFGAKKSRRVTLNCVTCDGTGKITREMQEVMNNFWCRCEEPGETHFYADGQHAGLNKHHYRCSKCGRVTQVG